MDTPNLESMRDDAALDAPSLCRLLAHLDVSALPEVGAVFPSNGPQVLPLFRGANAELLLVHWAPGQATAVGTLGDASMAVRPVSGELELLSFSGRDAEAPQLVSVEQVGVGQLAGVPGGAVHALRARTAAITLHLCAPPVIWRDTFGAATV